MSMPRRSPRTRLLSRTWGRTASTPSSSSWPSKKNSASRFPMTRRNQSSLSATPSNTSKNRRAELTGAAASGMRRVVITGLGLVTPLASGVAESWSKLLAGRSGAKPITTFKVDDLPARIACTVPRGDGSDGTFNVGAFVEPKEQRRVDDFIIFALAAAQQAVDDSGFVPKDEDERCRTGVLIGSGIGGLPGIEEAAILLHEKGPRKLSPFF